MSNNTAYLISSRVVRRGFLQPKIAEVTITDGNDEWKFDIAATFTTAELQARFPYFNRLKPSAGGKEE